MLFAGLGNNCSSNRAGFLGVLWAPARLYFNLIKKPSRWAVPDRVQLLVYLWMSATMSLQQVKVSPPTPTSYVEVLRAHFLFVQ